MLVRGAGGAYMGGTEGDPRMHTKGREWWVRVGEMAQTIASRGVAAPKPTRVAMPLLLSLAPLAKAR